MITTLKGINLLAKTQAGARLEFSKVVLGNGLPDDNAILNDQEQLKNFLKNLTGLVSPQMTTGIQNIEVIGDGTSVIRAMVSNANLSTGFLAREIGVFALDPDEGEILYSVDNFGYEADFLPAKGGTWVVEQELNLITIIGNAENVTAVINDSLAFATKEDLSKLKLEIDSIKTTVTNESNVELPDNIEFPNAKMYFKLMSTGKKWNRETWNTDPDDEPMQGVLMTDGGIVAGVLQLNNGTIAELNIIPENSGE